jgi:hypothetical protein
MVVGYGTVRRPSYRPPMKMIRFWGEVAVGVGVCSKAVRREVCLMLEWA